MLSVRDHPLFERDGPNLLCEVPVSISQAALGSKVEVPTIDGKTEVEIEPGTQSGDVVRLRGEGLPRLGGGPRGDQIVRIFVEVPTRLSSEQRELPERFPEICRGEITDRPRGFSGKLGYLVVRPDADSTRFWSLQ